MKSYIILWLIAFQGFLSFGQAYVPLLDELNEWQFTYCYSGCVTSNYYTNGDTLVDGESYKILDGYHFISRTILLREDVQDRKVYLNRLTATGKKMFLLYDFSKQEGDTMNLFNPLGPFIENPGQFRLDSIRQKELFSGELRRYFYWSPVGENLLPNNYPVWIEGVGSTSLVNAAAGHADLNGVGKLSCFFKNQELDYADYDSIAVCVPTTTVGLELLSNQAEFKILNATTEQLKWCNGEVVQIRIFNFQGQTLVEKKIELEQNQINYQAIQKGNYFVEFTFQNHLSRLLYLFIH